MSCTCKTDRVGWTHRTKHHPRGTPVNCDCGADSEDQAAGIHGPGCASRDGAPDDPSDHYGQ